jgi:4-hydroxyphenylpyruvate dioxygenase-like putative hemolysin
MARADLNMRASFLHDFLGKHGEGVHYLTLDVPDAKAAMVIGLSQRMIMVPSRRY